MSNPIKSLLPTPLSMQFISDINALQKIPLSIFRFFVDCAICSKPHFLTQFDDYLLASVLKRQKISQSIGSGAINGVKILQKFSQKVLKLMKTSQPNEIQTNLQNCQKYIKSVLVENTLLQELRVEYILQKLSSNVQKVIKQTSSKIQTSCGVVEWSIFSLKKINLRSNQSGTDNRASDQKQGQKGRVESHSQSNLKSINKMYVKVSFDQNFSQCQIQKLIGSRFQSSSDGIIQAKVQQIQNYKYLKSKSFTMSLIDFKLFMEQLEKIKNLNY